MPSSYRLNSKRIGFWVDGMTDEVYDKISHIYRAPSIPRSTEIYLLFFSAREFHNVIKMWNLLKQNLAFLGLVPAGVTNPLEIIKIFKSFTKMLNDHHGEHLQVAFLLGNNQKIIKFINDSDYKRQTIQKLLTQRIQPEDVSLIIQDLTKLKIFID